MTALVEDAPRLVRAVLAAPGGTGPRRSRRSPASRRGPAGLHRRGRGPRLRHRPRRPTGRGPLAASRPGRVLLRLHDLVLARQDEVLDLIQLETGKARKHAFEEVVDVALVARHYGVARTRYLRAAPPRRARPDAARVDELHHPKGVVGIISPWNYPLTLAVSDALPAFLAGNAVVLKPDTQTALTALWAHRAARSRPGCRRGSGRSSSATVRWSAPPWSTAPTTCASPGRPGSAARSPSAAGARLIGCSLELGGKNPMLVLDDADLDARGGGRGAGLLHHRRAAVRLDGAASRSPSGARAVHGAVRCAASARCGSAPGSTSPPTWARWCRRASWTSSPPRGGRAREGRHGRSPAAGPAPTSGRCSTSRPC